MVGTVLSGARSDVVENVLFIGRRDCVRWGGGDERIPVEDVGTGVGYLCLALRNVVGDDLVGESSLGDSRATRLTARGSGGEEEYGSKAGSNDGTGAGRLTPTMEGTGTALLRGEGSIVPVRCFKQDAVEVAYVGLRRAAREIE